MTLLPQTGPPTPVSVSSRRPLTLAPGLVLVLQNARTLTTSSFFFPPAPPTPRVPALPLSISYHPTVYHRLSSPSWTTAASLLVVLFLAQSLHIRKCQVSQ